MEVDEAIREIDEAIEQTFDRRRREEAMRGTGSRREAYEKSLREIDRLVGEAGVLALSEWIAEQIRTEERFPSSREARARGAEICRNNEREVPSDSWLGI